MYGSALNPGTLHTRDEKDKAKEIAKPNAKIEVKTYNRDAKGGATQSAIEAQKKVPKEKDIWTEEEVNIKAEEIPDDRP